MSQATDTDERTSEHTSELKVTDRCDHRNCNAQARVRAHLLEGPLDFCAHHYAPIEEALTRQALSVTDERERIN